MGGNELLCNAGPDDLQSFARNKGDKENSDSESPHFFLLPLVTD